MESVELVYSLKEFGVWEGCKIQKIFYCDDMFVFHVYKSNVGKQFLVFKIPDSIYLSSTKPPLGDIGALGSRLRKIFGAGGIEKIEQVGHERIVLMVINTKDTTYRIYIELFGKGNFVVCDSLDKIILPWQSQTYTKRLLKRGEQYQLPPARESVFLMNDKSFYSLFDVIEKNVSSTLAKAGLGRKYSVEVCVRAKVDPLSPEINTAQLSKIHAEVGKLLEHPIEAGIVGEEVEPFHMESLDGEHNVKESFSAALSSLVKWEKPKSAYEKKIIKIETILEKQQMAVNKMDDTILKNNKKAELLYTHYEMVKEVLDLGEGIDVSKYPQVLKIDKKNKTITLELE